MRGVLDAIAAVLAVHASPVSAEKYAETAAQLAEAIRLGDIATQRAMLPRLSELEYAEVARLSNCDAYMGGTGSDKYLVIDWECGASSEEEELSRTTVMVFDDHGGLFGFAINRRMGTMEPTSAAVQDTDMPKPRVISRQFAKAVVSGGDAGLGGLLALNDFEKKRLSQFKGGHFRITPMRSGGQFEIIFSKGAGRSSPSERVMIAQDEDGRFLGVVFAPTYGRDGRSRYHDDGARDQMASTGFQG